jgi:hypothetical protein
MGKVSQRLWYATGHAATVGMLVAVMASYDTGLGEALFFERADERPGVQPARCFHTVTSTAGDSSSITAELGGTGFPSSRISSRMSFTAS